MLSPGPLARPHADLDSDDDCMKCHTRSEGVPDRLCRDCHTLIDTRIEARRGYHGRAIGGRACADCHKDHRGRGAALIRWPGGAPERFSHALTGYRLDGAHAEAGCRDCHTSTKITEAEARKIDGTWLGLPSTCAECHATDDPHDGEFAGRACTACHGQEKWDALDRFDHDRSRFPLVGEHRDVECAGCHTQPRYTGTATECVDCHQSPHPAGTKFGPDCASCHSPRGWKNVVYPIADHRFFPLEGGHAIKDCAQCHGEKGNAAPSPACASCHEDVHTGRFGSKCQSCHDIFDWRKVRRSAFDHDRTAFPLKGLHVTAQCEDCHPKGKLKPIAHERCLDCHQDPHGGEVGAVCEDCHVEQGFRPSTYPLAKHTTFALAGAHAATACDDCHRIEDAWRFRKGVIECHECHEDRHEGQFGERPCTACHAETHWQPASAFDHAKVWALEGKHVDTPCAHCHADGRYAETPRACGECHGAPHLGQFAATSPRLGCTDCHTPAGWTGTYDHTRVWPLDGAHSNAACKDCHKEAAVADGRMTVRWRLGFQDCARCHSSPHRDPEGGAP
ncbi:MAG: hypothetical protein KC620_23360 [Myxococcales bacterium]|nr:hypothetical protein [Myxococcales bacterium]